MERLPNRYPKISQSHKVPLYKGLSLFYPKLLQITENNYSLRVKPVNLSFMPLEFSAAIIAKCCRHISLAPML